MPPGAFTTDPRREQATGGDTGLSGNAFMRAALRGWLNTAMAFRALTDHPGRSFLTLLGIVIGIIALVVMMALIGALDSSVRAATRPLGVGVFQVQREPRFGGGGMSAKDLAKRKSFTMDDLRELRRRLELTREVGGEMWSWMNAIRTSERKTQPACHIVGGTPSFLESNGIELEAGRPIAEQDLMLHSNVAVIGSDVVETLFPGGTREAIGSTIRLRGRPFTVVGTMAKRPTLFGAAWRNCVVEIPIDTFHRSFFFQSLHITFIARDPENIGPAQDEVVATLRAMRKVKYGDPDDFETFSNQSVSERLNALSVIIGGAAASICVIALLVGGIGVMNIMLISVMERTREIGIRKALGARRLTILGQFITEAVVLALVGGVGGVLLASVAVQVAGRVLELPAEVPGFAVALALASSAITGLVAGIYPAARAAKLDPIEALRYE